MFVMLNLMFFFHGDVFGDTYFHNRAGVDFYLTYLHVAHMITYLHVPQHLGWGGDVTVLTTCTHGGCSFQK